MPKMRMSLKRGKVPSHSWWMDGYEIGLRTPLFLQTHSKSRIAHATRKNVISFIFLSILSLGLCLLCYTNYFPHGAGWVNPGLPWVNYWKSSARTQVPAAFPSGKRGCNFPRLNPFSNEIKEFLRDPPVVDCYAHYPIRFRTNFHSQIISLQKFAENETCCYRTVERGEESDRNLIYSKTCYPVSSSQPTTVPPTHEFIFLKCAQRIPSNTTGGKLTTITTHKDMFAFVHKKPGVEHRVSVYERHILKPSGGNQERMSVLIIGLDAQSRMNFIRQMPKTHSFLVQNLSAVGLQGYTKVGENTFPNAVALLSGLTLEQLKEECWTSKTTYFDSCPFIWKDYAGSGYRTSFAEDSVWMGTFNYEKRGFYRPPSDYYLHPITLLMANKIGHETWGNAKLCYGPRLAFEVLLDYVVKTAITFQYQPYFQYVWSNSLFHDYLNNPKLGDELLHLTLDYLSANGYLDNTLLVVVSDHGMRWGTIRTTYQGKIEERMPTAYFVFPKTFRSKYPEEMQFLGENSVSRLTTPFDFHATLAHVLELETGTRVETKGAGISLLKPIPMDRDCPAAGVEEHWCVCNAMRSVPKNSSLAQSAAAFIVKSINGILHPFRKECAKLKIFNISEVLKKVDLSLFEPVVKNVSTAAVTTTKNSTSRLNSSLPFGKGESSKSAKHHQEKKIQLQITLTTTPGFAMFEATVNGKEDGGHWTISGDVSRLNLYRDQSFCIKDFVSQKYCYCNSLLDRQSSTVVN